MSRKSFSHRWDQGLEETNKIIEKSKQLEEIRTYTLLVITSLCLMLLSEAIVIFSKNIVMDVVGVFLTVCFAILTATFDIKKDKLIMREESNISE